MRPWRGHVLDFQLLVESVNPEAARPIAEALPDDPPQGCHLGYFVTFHHVPEQDGAHVGLKQFNP